MANENTGFAVAPEGGVSQDEYASGSWDWFRPLHITGNQGTSVSSSISTAGLAEQSGIKTTVAKPDMNLQLGRIHDKTQRDDTYFNILSGQGAFNSQGVKFDFDTMINKGITGQGSDKTSWEGKLGNITNYMPMLLGMGGGKQGFGATLEGPTGKQVFSIGGFSENALQKHYKNFTTSSASYDEMNKVKPIIILIQGLRQLLETTTCHEHLIKDIMMGNYLCCILMNIQHLILQNQWKLYLKG